MSQANSGKAGAARFQNLDATDLANAERHGKREDASSARRKVSDDEPLVFGGLNVRELAEQHRAGAKQQGKVQAVHALIQFPQELVPNEKLDQELMLNHAVAFVNEFHGGDAVFAARLDRDEKGTHKVDVFFLPKWEFSYKDGRTQARCGLGQYTKKQARERYGKSDRRACGSAVQDAFYEYLRDEMHIEGVMRPNRKKATAKDRVEPEEYALEQEKRKAALQRTRDDERAAQARQAAAEAQESTAKAQAAKIIAEGRQEAAQVLSGAKESAEALHIAFTAIDAGELAYRPATDDKPDGISGKRAEEGSILPPEGDAFTRFKAALPPYGRSLKGYAKKLANLTAKERATRDREEEQDWREKALSEERAAMDKERKRIDADARTLVFVRENKGYRVEPELAQLNKEGQERTNARRQSHLER